MARHWQKSVVFISYFLWDNGIYIAHFDFRKLILEQFIVFKSKTRFIVSYQKKFSDPLGKMADCLVINLSWFHKSEVMNPSFGNFRKKKVLLASDMKNIWSEAHMCDFFGFHFLMQSKILDQRSKIVFFLIVRFTLEVSNYQSSIWNPHHEHNIESKVPDFLAGMSSSQEQFTGNLFK